MQWKDSYSNDTFWQRCMCCRESNRDSSSNITFDYGGVSDGLGVIASFLVCKSMFKNFKKNNLSYYVNTYNWHYGLQLDLKTRFTPTSLWPNTMIECFVIKCNRICQLLCVSALLPYIWYGSRTNTTRTNTCNNIKTNILLINTQVKYPRYLHLS